MNRSLLLTTLIGSLTAFGVQASEDASRSFTANVSGLIGQASMEKQDWEEQHHAQVGVIADFRMKNWPVSIAADVLVSSEKNDARKSDGSKKTLYAGVNTTYLGLRKIWQLNDTSFHPYLGGGLAFTHAYKETLKNNKKEDETDDGVGGWIGTGVYWRFTDHWNLGFDLRYTNADVTLSDRSVDTGGMRYGLSAGYHW